MTRSSLTLLRSAKRRYRMLGEFLTLGRTALGGDKEAKFLLLRNLGMRYPIIEVNGFRMKLDLTDNFVSKWLFLYGPWEPCQTRILSGLLQQGMTFIDVGAHIGCFSLLAGRALQRSGRVIAFEPSPLNYRLLVKNIRLNDLADVVTVENLALGDKNSQLELFLSASNAGDHRIYEPDAADNALFNAGNPRRSVRVDCVRLDDYLTNQGVCGVDAIKIDVQGAEMAVLQGARSVLTHNTHLILFIEFWPFGLLEFGTQPIDLLTFLSKDLGLSLSNISSERNALEPMETSEFLSWALAQDPQRQIDLLGVR